MPGAATAADDLDTVRARFIGTWELVATGRTIDGVEQPNSTWGAHPCGIIMYHPNGYMSAVLHSGTPEHRPRGTSIAASPEQLEKDEHKWALLAQHASGYSGPFSLDLSHQQVIHGPLHCAMRPELVGQLQPRDYRFEESAGGEFLELSANLTPNCRDTMLWRRLA